MIVRIQTGRSFFGAALYFLHDKKHEHELLRLSDERVAWTHTHNCASPMPEIAVHEMIAVATHQAELKRESGHAPGGRKCDEPVMTISLSWHPVEKPAKEEMIEAARGFLQHMGWQEHQALFLAHNDTQHQHVHIVLNRVHPSTGLVHNNFRDQQRAGKWRERYEREHGKFRDEATPQRHIQHGLAKQGRAVQLKYAELETQNTKAQERFERRQLSHRHQQERETFLSGGKQQFKDTSRAAFETIRAKHRPLWVEHYRQTQHSLEFARRQAQPLRRQAVRAAHRNDFDAARAFNTRADTILNTAQKLVAEDRQQLNATQRTETREAQDLACKQLFDQRKLAFETLKDHQQQDRGELRGIQTARADNEPFSATRLKELLSEVPPTERAPAGQGREGEPAPILLPTAPREAEERITHDAPMRAPRHDGFDGAAGGIGKAAEIISDALGSFFAPPTPQEQAIEKAKAQAEAEAAPDREADAQMREAAARAQSTSDKI